MPCAESIAIEIFNTALFGFPGLKNFVEVSMDWRVVNRFSKVIGGRRPTTSWLMALFYETKGEITAKTILAFPIIPWIRNIVTRYNQPIFLR